MPLRPRAGWGGRLALAGLAVWAAAWPGAAAWAGEGVLPPGVERRALRLAAPSPRAAGARVEVARDRLLVRLSARAAPFALVPAASARDEGAGCESVPAAPLAVCAVGPGAWDPRAARAWLAKATRDGRAAALAALWRAPPALAPPAWAPEDEPLHERTAAVRSPPRAAPELPLRAAPRQEPASPAERAAVVAIAALVALLLAAGLAPTRDRARGALLVAAASLATRAAVPLVPLHVASDDLRLAAAALGASGMEIEDFNSRHGAVLPFFRFFTDLLGHHVEALHLASLLLGALLPLAGYLLALAWLDDRRVAVTTGLLLVASPVAFAFSGGITAYLPGATLFAFSLAAGLGAGRLARPLVNPAAWLLVVVSAALLALAALLKPELLLLVPAWTLTVALVHRDRASYVRAVALPVALVVAAVVAVGFPQYVGAFLYSGRQRTGAFGSEWILHAGVYAAAFVLVNPPFLPLKVVFLQGLLRPGGRRLLAARLLVLGLAGLYALSRSPLGFNQWRHSLAFLVPFMLACAPAVLGWWDARRWRPLALLLAFDAAGFAFYAWHASGQPDPRALRSAAVDEGTLVLYAAHPQDDSPEPLLATAGVPAALALDALWPATCPDGLEQRRVPLRSHALSLAYDALSRAQLPGLLYRPPPALLDARRLPEALDALEAAELGPRQRARLAWLRDRDADVQAALDPDDCGRDLDARRAQLARFSRVMLLVDPAAVRDVRLPERFVPFRRAEAFELAAHVLDLAAPLDLERVGLVPVRRIGASDGRPLWEARR